MVAYEGSSGRVVQTTDLSPEHRKLLNDLEITPPKLVHDVA
jgi:Cft2 family RNA processing exonuclease